MADATRLCAECPARLSRKGPGPPPKYCSANCRARAGYRRAKADGRYQAQVDQARAKRQAEREAQARPCPYCGDLMVEARRVQCGKPECKRLWTNDRNLAWQRKYKAEHGEWSRMRFRYERTCGTCGEKWTSPEPKARFCSVGCANAGRVYEKTCDHCGTKWQAKTIQARWCSPDCARASRFSTAILPWRPQPWWTRRIWLTPPQPRRWYAGRCRRCDAPFVSDQPSIRYCSRECPRSDAKARRRARKKDAYVAHVYRTLIFERDRWTCQLCHRKVNKTAVVPHPMAPVLDHIIPLDDHGTHEPANVQCAHFLCNSTKGARGGGEQLLLIG